MDYLLLIWFVFSCIIGCKDNNTKSEIKQKFGEASILSACPEVCQGDLCIIQVKQFPVIILQNMICPMILICPAKEAENGLLQTSCLDAYRNH